MGMGELGFAWQTLPRSFSHSAHLGPLGLELSCCPEPAVEHRITRYGAEEYFLGRMSRHSSQKTSNLQVVVCVNFLAVGIVFYRMRNVKCAKDKDLLKTVQKWTRGVAVLVPLLGLPWIFGLLMLANEFNVFDHQI